MNSETILKQIPETATCHVIVKVPYPGQTGMGRVYYQKIHTPRDQYSKVLQILNNESIIKEDKDVRRETKPTGSGKPRKSGSGQRKPTKQPV